MAELDHKYEMRQLRIFQKMVEQGTLSSVSAVPWILTLFFAGLIYRHYRPVHFSPSSRSALAEAELVYKDDHVSHSVFVTFDLDKGVPASNAKLQALFTRSEPVKILVWTTTPWTLTANMGVAVHPELQYVAVRSNVESAAVHGLVIVAKERLEALAEVLGEMEVIAELTGPFDYLLSCILAELDFEPRFRPGRRDIPSYILLSDTSE